MAKHNVFALLNAFTGSFVSYFRLFRCFDSIRLFVIRLIFFRFTFRFDSSGILVYLLSLRSEGGCETDQTNDCVQVNLFINNGSVFNFALLRFVYYGYSQSSWHLQNDSINSSDYSGSEHATLQGLRAQLGQVALCEARTRQRQRAFKDASSTLIFKYSPRRSTSRLASSTSYFYSYLSHIAPSSEGGCQSSAKLRSRVFVVYWYLFSNSCTVVRSLGLCLV